MSEQKRPEMHKPLVPPMRKPEMISRRESAGDEPVRAGTLEEIKEDLSEAARILQSYGGLESNVPINSNYWNLKWNS